MTSKLEEALVMYGIRTPEVMEGMSDVDNQVAPQVATIDTNRVHLWPLYDLLTLLANLDLVSNSLMVTNANQPLITDEDENVVSPDHGVMTFMNFVMQKSSLHIAVVVPTNIISMVSRLTFSNRVSALEN